MMIDDLELRALFKAETEEHLQTLEEGLLHLEAEPHDSAILEELFRSAHSLKGAAGMLGIASVETLAHHFEDVLGATRRGHLAMSAATADRLYQGLDAMRRLAREACNGEPANVDIPAVLAQLRGETLPEIAAIEADSTQPTAPEADKVQAAPEEAGRFTGSGSPETASLPEAVASDARQAASVEPPAGLPVISTASLPVVSPSTLPVASEEGSALGSQSAFKIETIRVEPQKLDALMTLAGEMAVTTTRVARALTAIDDLVALWEEWGRDATALGLTPATLKDSLIGGGALHGKQLAHFHERETGRIERLGTLLDGLKRTNDVDLARLGSVAYELEAAIQSLRLLPFSTLFNLFPRLVRDLSQEQEKEVQLVMEGGSVTADKHLLEAMKDPLMHMLRNAIDHGIERPEERERQGKPRAATLRLHASRNGTNIVLEIADDGKGLDAEAIRRSALQKRLRSAGELAGMSAEEVQMLIFTPGFSTSALITDLSGRGVGLDVVRTNIERLKGTIAVESRPGMGCTFRLQAPMTLATTRVLLVKAAQRTYALPVEAVHEIFLVSAEARFSLEGRAAVRWDDQPIAAAILADLLELPSEQAAGGGGKGRGEQGIRDSALRPCILLTLGAERLGLFVDDLLEEQEVILKPFGGLLQRVRNVFGAAILSTGEVCMVLNPQDLLRSAQKLRALPAVPEPDQTPYRRKVVLLAEDSITTRTQEKRILESAGYEVVTAVDGADAFHKLGTRLFDAVVSDIEMPNMDGLTLAARIRQDVKYQELPIILVTSLASEGDRRRGVEVGANAYLTKGAFDQTVLLNALRRLI
jgi:two-component system chemotaxis sensor kinase CheA